MNVNWPITTLMAVLVCAAVAWYAYFTNPATNNEAASLSSAPPNNVNVERKLASKVIDREYPRANEFNLAKEFKRLHAEIAGMNERLSKLEGSMAVDIVENSLTSEAAARVEKRMTEDDETDVLEQLSKLNNQFSSAIDNAWSRELQIGLEQVIADDNELIQAITSVGCRSTICRFDMEQGAKTAYTFTRLIQKQPNITQMIQRSVSFKKWNGTTVFFLDFEE